jgi:hypothetical protein
MSRKVQEIDLIRKYEKQLCTENGHKMQKSSSVPEHPDIVTFNIVGIGYEKIKEILIFYLVIGLA